MNGRELMPLAEVQLRQAEQRAVSENWLRSIAGDWPTAVCRALEWEPAVVRVVIASASGSTPREAGTCMIVGPSRVAGTIGGGRLEWEAAHLAREMVPAAAAGNTACTKRLVLASQLGQCCGGVVELWLERFTRGDLPLLRSASSAASSGEPVLMTSTLANGRVTRRVVNAATPAFLPPRLRPVADALLDRDARERAHFAGASLDATGDSPMLLERLDIANASLWLYGAGHVAQALVRVMSELPVTVRWIDPRGEMFPRVLPPNVRALQASAPAQIAGSAPPDVRHLVMTHDHALDYEVCRSILRRERFGWLGLIGSASKGARFRSRLRKEGIAEETLPRLICPIGVDGVEGKAPAIIAISVAAQLLQTMGTALDPRDSRPRAAATVMRAAEARAEWPVEAEALNGCRTGDCANCSSSRSANA